MKHDSGMLPRRAERPAQEMSETPRSEKPAGVLNADLFGQIVESSPHGVVMVDLDGRITLVNRETERMFGYSRGELIGQTIDALVPVRLRDEHSTFRREFTANPESRAMGAGRDLFGLNKDGTEIPIEIALNPIRTEQGTFVLASVVDISARRRAETRFRVVVEASPHGMLMVDPSGNIVLVNQEIERLFDYSRDQLLGQSVDVLVPIEVRPHHPALRAGFHNSPRSRPMGTGRDLFGRRRDGAQIPVEIALNPIETDEGVFVLASVVDISPRKKAEEELRRSNEELERFAYVASHDLQEPLRTVTSYVQLLSKRYGDKLGGDAAEFIEFAVAGAARMQRLIEDLLAFSRVSTREFAPKMTDTRAVLLESLDDLHAAIADSGAVVTHDDLPSVLADAGQLEQLFGNLIGNALKFRGAEAPRIHVSAKRSGRHWEFAVRDNGIGIEAKYFERIFVIFQRLHVRDEYGGTGVGLAICKKLVERHGGRIWVESVPGKGTIFFFKLPAVPQ
jgi:PAS domain S-box-containing protein